MVGRAMSSAWYKIVVALLIVMLGAFMYQSAAKANSKYQPAAKAHCQAGDSADGCGGDAVGGILVNLGFSWAEGTQWIELQNVNTGLCLSSHPDQIGQPATQQKCNGSQNQEWNFGEDSFDSSLESFGMRIPTHTGDDLGCLVNQRYEDGTIGDYNTEIMQHCSSLSASAIADAGWTFAKSASSKAVMLVNDNEKHGFYCATSLGNRTVGSGVFLYTCNRQLNSQQWIPSQAG